jgi:DNA-binding transcriptional ArsR family regulator
MHEQTGENIVEKFTREKAEEILNDDVKMSILNILKNTGPLSFGDILKNLGISQPSGTNHILGLKRLGLIDKTEDPPNYNLVPERYEILINYQQKKSE